MINDYINMHNLDNNLPMGKLAYAFCYPHLGIFNFLNFQMSILLSPFGGIKSDFVNGSNFIEERSIFNCKLLFFS